MTRLNGGARTDDSKLTFIKAIDGSTLLNVPIFFNKPWPPHQSAGAYGCLKSHIKAIKDAKEKKYETILILEDDVTFNPDFQWCLATVFHLIPDDWQSLFLGGNLQETPTRINGVLAQGKSYAAHAYFLKNSLFDTIIEWGDTVCDTAIDVYYADKLQTQDTNYLAYPLLCSQEPGYSDIERQTVDHRAVLNKKPC